ncbi:MAG TPA: heme-binding domain-containing protein [Chitinophagaceae bacterium]|nr:heme-binding domain-containing protein [Chitinophagaceae bacterium]
MKKVIKTIGWLLLITLLVIQFFHPKKNIHPGDQVYALGKLHPVPDDVKVILKKACNDCHTNNTVYPWYTRIQPVDWWLNDHVVEGKGNLNFDSLAAKPAWFRYHKMEEVIDEVKEGKMPLNSYTWLHKDAVLTQDEKAKLTNWAQAVRDEMKQKYPADSLVRPKRPEPPKS